ncbi:MAG: hypothetical protein CVV04_02680 [Firmicutes bacterium HGW-Firmicutes-9]|nr:MAG: hypothetical protein CVV04_02680 [Firmicutes bacterium HGW-Firmicutes-9]
MQTVQLRGIACDDYSLVNNTTVSTWHVCGNMSTGRTAERVKPCAARYLQSRARVAGLQEKKIVFLFDFQLNFLN